MAEVEAAEQNKKQVSPYRLNLEPGKEQRRPEWNLIFIADIPVTIDFYHTDMIEKVIKIQKAEFEVKKEGGDKEW